MLRRQTTQSGKAILAASCLAVFPLAAAAQTTSAALATLREQAVALEHGEGVPKEPIRAVELYCQAARGGDAEAQYQLGWIYTNGRGVMRNDGLAALFFSLAAEQGHQQAAAMRDRQPPSNDELPECMHDDRVVEYDDKPMAELAAVDYDDVSTFVPANDAQKKIAELVRKIAPEYSVSPLLALAFIRAESNFDPYATSPKNAQGLMQLIPETSSRFQVKKPYDPMQNIRGGLAYLRWLLAYFRGNVELVAAAYNAGERAVERYRGVPPYLETREYVGRILSLFRHRQHPFDPSVTDPSPELQRISTNERRSR
jgi:TPR repeat protein